MSYRDQISAMFNDAKVTLKKRPAESYMSKTDQEGEYLVKIANWTAAGFTLVCMPGCCGVVISTNCYVNPNWREHGLGTLLNNMRKQMAYEMGYTLLLCTDVTKNIPQQKILNTNGWTKLLEFNNRRTGNTVSLDMIILRDTGIALGF